MNKFADKNVRMRLSCYSRTIYHKFGFEHEIVGLGRIEIASPPTGALAVFQQSATMHQSPVRRSSRTFPPTHGPRINLSVASSAIISLQSVVSLEHGLLNGETLLIMYDGKVAFENGIDLRSTAWSNSLQGIPPPLERNAL